MARALQLDDEAVAHLYRVAAPTTRRTHRAPRVERNSALRRLQADLACCEPCDAQFLGADLPREKAPARFFSSSPGAWCPVPVVVMPGCAAPSPPGLLVADAPGHE